MNHHNQTEKMKIMVANNIFYLNQQRKSYEYNKILKHLTL